MSGGPRLPAAAARAMASELVARLEPACARLELAGSLRRGSPDVGDLEICCTARSLIAKGGLFQDVDVIDDLLARRVEELLGDGTVEPRLDKNGRRAMGARYRRLTFRGFPVDLFSPLPECWGVVFLIRTGPADFSRRVVTPRRQGGLLPDWLRFEDGRIWQGEQALKTPEEEDVFKLLNLPFIPPDRRDVHVRAPIAT